MRGICVWIRAEFHDIFHLAFQNGAEDINGMGGDIGILLQTADLAGAEAVILYKPILGDAPFLQGLPESVINHHNIHPLSYLIRIIPICILSITG